MCSHSVPTLLSGIKPIPLPHTHARTHARAHGHTHGRTQTLSQLHSRLAQTEHVSESESAFRFFTRQRFQQAPSLPPTPQSQQPLNQPLSQAHTVKMEIASKS